MRIELPTEKFMIFPYSILDFYFSISRYHHNFECSYQGRIQGGVLGVKPPPFWIFFFNLLGVF